MVTAQTRRNRQGVANTAAPRTIHIVAYFTSLLLKVRVCLLTARKRLNYVRSAFVPRHPVRRSIAPMMNRHCYRRKPTAICRADPTLRGASAMRAKRAGAQRAK